MTRSIRVPAGFKPPANWGGARPSDLALGRLPKGEMNKTEAEYAQLLESRRAAGEVLWWRFEAIKLRLADATFYETDFLVMTAACVLEVHEVKGRWHDDARVKIKVAAALFPFRFIAVQKRPKRDGGGWNIEEF